MNTQDKIKKIVELLQNTEIIFIHTGAGMSADSGLPVYRGENGIWGQLEGELQGDIRNIMTPRFIKENPIYMWKRFARGRKREKFYPPHSGYYILLRWIQEFQLPYFAITSNVDSMFQKAGFAEDNILEIHGSGFYQQCTTPCTQDIWENKPQFDPENPNISLNDLPKCPYCQELARPNVLIFRDKTFVPTRVTQQKENLASFIERHQDKKAVIFEIGAGKQIKTIRRYTNKFLKEFNAVAIRINPHDSEIELPNIALPFKAKEILEEIDVFLTDK